MFDKLVIAAISPLGTALLLGALALWWPRRAFWRRPWNHHHHQRHLPYPPLRHRRGSGWRGPLAGVALAWLALWSLPVVSHAFRWWWESPYPPVVASSAPQAQAVVLLGGGIRPAGLDGSAANMGAAADRMWMAAELMRAGKAPVVVLSGGSNPTESATSEAQAMQQVLLALGVPQAAMRLEERSRNTRQNASETAALLLPQGQRRILLVTSALHMRRAVRLFQAQGFDVIPAPTDHEGRLRLLWQDAWPEADALEGSARAIKEVVAELTGR